jgi:hypothetical protein
MGVGQAGGGVDAKPFVDFSCEPLMQVRVTHAMSTRRWHVVLDVNYYWDGFTRKNMVMALRAPWGWYRGFHKRLREAWLGLINPPSALVLRRHRPLSFLLSSASFPFC